MKVGITIRYVPYGNGYECSTDRWAVIRDALDGRLGDWLRLHNFDENIDVLSLCITLACSESQYLELLLGFEGEYLIEILEK